MQADELREILDHSCDILYRRDLHSGVYDYLSRAFVRLLGYSQEEVAGMAWEEVGGLIHPQDRERHDACLQTLLDADSAIPRNETVEYRLRCKDGTYRWFRDQMTIVRDPAGQPLYLLGNNRDITEHRNVEQTLAEIQGGLFIVLDSIEAHIFAADMQTYEVLFMNRKMKEDFGHPLEGCICWQVFRGGQGPCAHCTNSRLIDSQGKPTGVCVWEGRNPVTRRWYVNHDQAIKWNDGRLVRLQIAFDVTDVKRLELERGQAVEKLQQAQKLEAIGTLAGGIAHDFNNLLMGIVGHLNLIQLDLEPDHPQLARIAKIEEMVLSGRQLTGQLLSYARKGKFEARFIDLNPIVREALEAVSRMRKDIMVRLDLVEAAAIVWADRSQMVQMLWNLCANASDAMPEGGMLTVSTRIEAGQSAEPGQVVLTVADSGQGIEAEIRDRIFEPFFTTKYRGRGTGMGLASVYGIVKGHGGHIQVSSEPGKGACFTVSLPAMNDRGEDPSVPAPAASKIRTILLVDDEDFVREIGRDLLEHLGFSVVEAQNGEQAVALLAESGDMIDLVILDLIMPEMSGTETFDRLKRIDPAVRVLLSSGYSLEGEAQALLDRGCDGFIQKPFTIAQLKEKIERILSLARPK